MLGDAPAAPEPRAPEPPTTEPPTPDLREIERRLDDLSALVDRRAADLRLWVQTVLGFSLLGYFLLAALILIRS